MNTVVPFPGEGKNGAGSDGGGPEDPMLEQRVGRLEEKVDRIEAILLRIDAKVTEVLQTGAKRSADIIELKATGANQADLTKLQMDFVRFEANAATKDDLQGLQAEVVEIKNRQTLIDGRLTGIDGRLSGISDRFASLPTVWTMLGIVFTTWALGSGILIFAMNYSRK